MRISDWSSDVCSSDLGVSAGPGGVLEGSRCRRHPYLVRRVSDLRDHRCLGKGHRRSCGDQQPSCALEGPPYGEHRRPYPWVRSEERRVGNRCVSQVRLRWSAYNSKKKREEKTN